MTESLVLLQQLLLKDKGKSSWKYDGATKTNKQPNHFLVLLAICPNLSKIFLNSHNLFVKCVKIRFMWERPQQTAFENIKQVVINELSLALYNPEKDVVLSADSSAHNLGQWCPTCFSLPCINFHTGNVLWIILIMHYIYCSTTVTQVACESK